MIKNLLIKLLIVIIVAALAYSVFWFFKVGQVEKQINKFVSENSSYVSTGEISVSGFPMSQKITIQDLKFTIPNALVNNRQVVVKQLEARAEIFSSDFSVTLIDPVSLVDTAGNSLSVEFSQAPQITIAIAGGKIAKFSYQDSGYRALDADKKLVYAASASSLTLDSSTDDTDKTTTKILVNIKDIEGFDALNAYKNAFEKKIIDGIKTGEISVGAAALDAVTSVDSAAPAVAAKQAAQAAAPIATNVASEVNSAAGVNSEAATAAAGLDNAVSNAELIKGNFVANLEYVTTPVKVAAENEEPQVPSDPTQIQEVPAQYSKLIKINNFEFSNPLYKITANGEMNVFADDNMPSGAFTVKIEKFETLVGYISAGLTKIGEELKPSELAEVRSSDLTSAGLPVEDSYQNFLKKISSNLNSVAKELAAKNAVSTDSIAQFDIRREKNLEFLVNETSVREILGKF